MSPRAGVLLIEGQRIALIERRRGDLRYHVFPGGGVDPGEDFAGAALREAHEELGVEVELIGDPVRMQTPSEHRYWRARVVGGSFGGGHGVEMTSPHPWKGTYEPVWVELDRLEGLRIIPRSLAGFVVRAERDGWPDKEVTLIEWAWLESGPEEKSADPFVSETTAVTAATRLDIPAWLDLAAEVEDLFGEPMSRDPSFRAVLEKNIDRGTAFVARENWGAPGTPIAGALLWRPGANAIGWLAVAKRWRRRGIGSALVEHALSLGTDRSVTVVTFADDAPGAAAARAFYLRHGFAPVPLDGDAAPGRQTFMRAPTD